MTAFKLVVEDRTFVLISVFEINLYVFSMFVAILPGSSVLSSIVGIVVYPIAFTIKLSKVTLVFVSITVYNRASKKFIVFPPAYYLCPVGHNEPSISMFHIVLPISIVLSFRLFI